MNRAEAIKKHERYLSLQKERQEEEALYSDHYSERLLGESLERAGTSISTKTFFQEKATRLVILAFGAFWSAKSRSVIAKLVKLCEGKSDVLRVVFLSSDRSKAEFDRFTRTFSSNEGIASVPFHRRDTKGMLAQRLHINESRLPKLVLIDCKANGQVLTHDAGAAFDGSENPLNIWVSMSCDKTPVVDEVSPSSNGQDKKQSVLSRARDLLSASSSSKEEEKKTEMTLETLIQSLNAEFGEEVVSGVRSTLLE